MTVVIVMMAAAARSTGDRTKTGIPGEPKTTTKTDRVTLKMTVWDMMEKVTARVVPMRDGNLLVGTRNTRREARACSTDLIATPLCHVVAGQNPIGRHEKKQARE